MNLHTYCVFFQEAKNQNVHSVGTRCTFKIQDFSFCLQAVVHSTEGSCLMRISLLRFFKKVHKFALCEFVPYASFHLCNFFDYFCPICLMQIFSRTKSRIRQEPSVQYLHKRIILILNSEVNQN